MMGYLAHPTPRWIASLFAVAGTLLVIGVWMVHSEPSVFAFVLILVGMTILFIGLAQLALWALNRVQGPPHA